MEGNLNCVYTFLAFSAFFLFVALVGNKVDEWEKHHPRKRRG